jgi:hypothetical protein
MSCMNQLSFGSQFCVQSDASLNQQVHASQAGNHEVISTADLLAAMHVCTLTGIVSGIQASAPGLSWPQRAHKLHL